MEEKTILQALRQRNHVFMFLDFLKAKKQFRILAEENTNEKLYAAPPQEYCKSCTHNLECGDYERSNCPMYGVKASVVPNNK